MKFLEKVLSKYIVSEINPEFEFVFCGIDLEDEEQKLKNIDAALKAGITSFEKQFEAFEGEKYNEKKHTILNQVFQSAQMAKQQMAMYGGGQSNEAVDNENGGEDEGVRNPFDEFDEKKQQEEEPQQTGKPAFMKAEENNPIMKSVMNYIETTLK
jgi:hypothetical protein